MKIKNTLLTIACAATTVLAAGCNQSSDTPAQTTAEQLDKVKAEAKTTSQDIKDYAFNQKAEFVAKMQAELDELNRNLDTLEKRIEKGSDTAKAEAQVKLKDLREKSKLLAKQLDDAKGANESTWDSIKAGSQKAFGDLKDGFNQARQWVSDKIAP